MLSLILAFSLHANAAVEHLRVAAASDLKFALDEVKSTFLKTHPDLEIEIAYGSSGQFEQQIEKGAPFDLFLSADESYPKMLVSKNLAHGEFKYGTGTLVLWSLSPKFSRLSDLRAASKIAVANPDHAPYGRAAKTALMSVGLYDVLKSKLVTGDSISQTAQFAQTGAADVGLIALALARSPALLKGHYVVVKEAEPLQQEGVLLSDKPGAKLFRDYLMSADGQSKLKEFGFKGAQ